ncbi:sensor histidine kinase [Caulobacter sp. LjRoot300]|uniref:sensor histidine kinase n=1 Tax=Caulobacter sp. LjRoot300 TaxID=3342321 RepID=UPI003ED0EE2A
MTSSPADRRQTRTILIATAGVWLLAYAAMTLGWVSARAPHFWDGALRRAVVCLVGALMCQAMGPLLLRSTPWPFVRRLALVAGLSLAGSLAFGVVDYTVYVAILPRWPESTFWGVMLIGRTVFWFFVAWAAIFMAVHADLAAREARFKLEAARVLATETQNRMLRYQISPHFLFNTLNALATLVMERQNDRAEQMILGLSGFLRRSLERDVRERVTLAEELDGERQYVAIEQIRFGERLRYVERAPPDLADALVPNLILQPIIENAVKHGLARSSEPVVVEVVAAQQDGRLSITVTDDGGGALDGPPGLGVGLENVRRRLETRYGDQAALTCGPRAPRGFQVRLDLPLERAG